MTPKKVSVAQRLPMYSNSSLRAIPLWDWHCRQIRANLWNKTFKILKFSLFRAAHKSLGKGGGGRWLLAVGLGKIWSIIILKVLQKGMSCKIWAKLELHNLLMMPLYNQPLIHNQSAQAEEFLLLLWINFISKLTEYTDGSRAVYRISLSFRGPKWTVLDC